MKQATTAKPLGLKVFLFLSSLALFLFVFILFCSFSAARFGDDFLKQLGLTKTEAEQKITDGILGGYVNTYGAKNAKNIAAGNRKALVLDILAYTKQQTANAAFVKKYNEMRERYRPKEYVPETPEQMKAANIQRAQESVKQMEEAYKKADAQYKPMFQKSIDDAKKYLKDAEDPNNRQYVRYAQNYDRSVKEAKEGYAHSTAEFLRKYPDNQLLFVKMRLQEFLDATKDVDFGAETTPKPNGKKYFVNAAYEHKDSRWKMAFRAGKEVIEPAREFVQKWVEEIK